MDYTLSHSDKPDCVRNDYGFAITLTPPHPDLSIVVAIQYGPRSGQLCNYSHVNSIPYGCAVHSLGNCAWQLHSQKPSDHVSSSQQPLLTFFLAIPMFRSYKEV